MTQSETILVPDIGDFKDVEIIEILVAAGDSVKAEDALITLESDKATMDVPCPLDGEILELLVKVGDRVSEGTAIATVNITSANTESTKPARDAASTSTVSGQQPEAPAAASSDPAADADVVVLGSGPGGYTAAFRAADLGLKTVLVERYPTLGGVCLNVGCIPSKALLHAARVIEESREMSTHGIRFTGPEIDIDALRGWKESVVGKLTGGLNGLAKQRKVTVIEGDGRFIDKHNLEIKGKDGVSQVRYQHAIIAAGSQSTRIPGIADDPRIMDSTGALALADIPGKLLVIGGGIIGLEMATVYHALGSAVTVVEMLDRLIAGADKDIVKPLHNRISKQYENIYLKTRVSSVDAGKQLTVTFENDKESWTETFDRILVAVGRKPNGHAINAAAAGVEVNDAGFIQVDQQMRTNVPHIFAIGDIVGQPMLAHKAVHEGKVAAEVAAGHKSGFEARVIPSVAYTDPEVAWVGVTEAEAREQKLNFGKGTFPWAASGRSLSLGRSEGLTKLLFDEDSKQVIGAGIVGPNAGDLIAEVALAIEAGLDAEDIGLTIHPHPTLSETVAFSAEAFEGTLTDLYIPKRKK